MTIQVFTGVDRPVVVKTATTASARGALQREAERLRRARHPGIVELTSVSPDRLEVAWVGAHTLETARLPVPAAAGVLAAVAETVADLHAMGLIHGRLDPSHVVIAADGRPVICGMVGPDPSDELTGPADDVAAIGRLIDHLLGPDAEPEPIPDRRWARKSWTGYHRRTLQLLADRASHEDPARRPTARAVANAIVEAVPDARLTPSEPSEPSERPVAPAPTPDGSPPSATDVRRDERSTAPAALDDVPPAARPAVGTGPRDTSAGDSTDSLDPVATGSPEVHGAVETLDVVDHPPRTSTSHLGPRRPVELPSHADDLDDRVLGLRIDRGGAGPSVVPPERSAPPTPPPHGRRGGRVLVVAAGVLVSIGVARSVVADRSAVPVGSGLVTAGPPDTVTVTVTETDTAADATPSTSPERGAGADRSEPAPTAASPTPAAPQPADAVDPAGTVPTPDRDGTMPAAESRSHPSGPPQVEWAGTTYAVGEPGDRVLVADWDCDGEASPGVVRPATGEVFLFDGWATEGESLVHRPAAVVPDAQALVPPPTDGDCQPAVRLGDGRVVVVPITAPGSTSTLPEGRR